MTHTVCNRYKLAFGSMSSGCDAV